jgi:cytidine deaminase
MAEIEIKPSQPIEALGAEWRDVIAEARAIQDRAYAPYSRFFVGSALRDERGRIHTGCNVENASYSAAICAERTAVVKMVSLGGRKIERVAVVTSSPEPCFPCGVCLQVLAEFADQSMEVVALDSQAQRFRSARLSELIPQIFGPERLLGRRP